MSEEKLDRRTFMMALTAAAAAQGDTPRKLRYGIVGAGNRARNAHFPIVRGYIEEAEIAAICDITPENLERALAYCPGAKGYADYHEMLAKEPDLDAVLVVIPNFRHAEVALAALEAGKHVLVEKPMALRLSDADRMIALAARKNRVLQVGQQYRYSPAFARMNGLVGQGAIGDLNYVFASLFRGDWFEGSWKYTDPATGKKTNWRLLTKTAGSSLLEDGIHELDVIHWLAGSQPVRVQAHGGNNVFRDRETIDNAGLLIEFANGQRVTFGYTVFTPDVEDARVLRLLGTKGEMALEGTHRTPEIVIRPFAKHAQVTRIPIDDDAPRPIADLPKPASPDPDTYREHKAFARSILKGEPVVANGRVGRDAIHISLAAERSLRTNRIMEWNDEEGL